MYINGTGIWTKVELTSCICDKRNAPLFNKLGTLILNLINIIITIIQSNLFFSKNDYLIVYKFSVH